ncbi:GNAT family N-acetyltransferase [Phocaeicola sp.]|uniref:GNAT family N-acetyltransferase n=1 Tax=Phocaeicola sp. TaxID=2773926 RepID=UPI0023C3E8F6|nr:GNAT family N-acetyltransferase [Phocaeicola sp.]MDE5677931.1 GNAT family N-acetyltransferase [Phocaeicola sp.]
MNGQIVGITKNKKRFLNLLLLGDEQESMIDRYLERGDMFVLEDNGVKAVCVVTRESRDVCELKNLAVAPEVQRQGYGRKLVNYLIGHYWGKCSRIIVGTGEVPDILAFYESLGFEYSHRVRDFFTENYDHPIVDHGVLLKDMVYLKHEMDSEKAQD